MLNTFFAHLGKLILFNNLKKYMLYLIYTEFLQKRDRSQGDVFTLRVSTSRSAHRVRQLCGSWLYFIGILSTFIYMYQ